MHIRKWLCAHKIIILRAREKLSFPHKIVLSCTQVRMCTRKKKLLFGDFIVSIKDSTWLALLIKDPHASLTPGKLKKNPPVFTNLLVLHGAVPGVCSGCNYRGRWMLRYNYLKSRSAAVELLLWLNLEVVTGTGGGGCNLCTSEGPGAGLGCQFT